MRHDRPQIPALKQRSIVDDLVRLQRCAQEARVAVDLAGQQDDLDRAA
ncbi:hypothetical protein [Salipiger aestuarii]|nr:hypothetical protein C357_08451 [Citreicella sp. 357]